MRRRRRAGSLERLCSGAVAMANSLLHVELALDPG